MVALFLLIVLLLDLASMFLIMPNVVGWWSCKQQTPQDFLPFNYRIYFGPNVYFTWLEKREAHEDNVGL